MLRCSGSKMSAREHGCKQAQCVDCSVENNPVSWLSVHTSAPRAVLSRWVTAELWGGPCCCCRTHTCFLLDRLGCVRGRVKCCGKREGRGNGLRSEVWSGLRKKVNTETTLTAFKSPIGWVMISWMSLDNNSDFSQRNPPMANLRQHTRYKPFHGTWFCLPTETSLNGLLEHWAYPMNFTWGQDRNQDF